MKSFFFSFLFIACSISCFTQDLVPFTNGHIVYEGRIKFNNDAAELIWPGSSITINFTGTGISGIFKDQDTSNYYNIIIDNKLVQKIQFDTLKKATILAQDLTQGEHSLQIFKRTEATHGKTWFYGFKKDDNIRLRQPEKPHKRKIEFFGNSITCGYAIEDTAKDFGYGYYENNYDSYAAITARHYKAQYHCTAYSGIGIMVSWGKVIMPEIYNLVDPGDSLNKWDFSRYTPNVVVVNLFQNDSWLLRLPNNPQFKKRFGTKAPDASEIIAAYKNFVQTIRCTYPKASIICMLGNMDITREGSLWPGYVQKAVEELEDKKIFTFFVPYKKTNGHPKVKEQLSMADKLIAFMDENIKW